MKLDLFEDLQKGPFEKDFALPFDLTETVISGQKHAVSGPEGISVHGKYDGSRLSLTGACDLTVTWPCDRCLSDTDVSLSAEIDLDFPVSDGRISSDPEDPEPYLENGHVIDLARVLSEEILLKRPEKVLCRPDCKGLCPVCGQNLNEGSCSCDKTVPDPRMAQIQDVFKKFKEVE